MSSSFPFQEITTNFKRNQWSLSSEVYLHLTSLCPLWCFNILCILKSVCKFIFLCHFHFRSEHHDWYLFIMSPVRLEFYLSTQMKCSLLYIFVGLKAIFVETLTVVFRVRGAVWEDVENVWEHIKCCPGSEALLKC